jgi:hypothetical protein
MRFIFALLLFTGCATTAPAPSVERHAQTPWALEAVYMSPVRAGQLSASREWERSGPDRVVTRTGDAILRDDFARDLARAVPLDVNSPHRLRATLTLQDTAYFEGLASEASDVTLTADILDREGNVTDSIVLRESAAAPLQRSASRQQRLAKAFDRLAQRLAHELAAR